MSIVLSLKIPDLVTFRIRAKESVVQENEEIQTITEKLKEKNPRMNLVEKNWKKPGGYNQVGLGRISDLTGYPAG